MSKSILVIRTKIRGSIPTDQEGITSSGEESDILCFLSRERETKKGKRVSGSSPTPRAGSNSERGRASPAEHRRGESGDDAESGQIAESSATKGGGDTDIGIVNSKTSGGTNAGIEDKPFRPDFLRKRKAKSNGSPYR